MFNDHKGALSFIWLTLETYQDTCEENGKPLSDDEWGNICYAMAVITDTIGER